MDSRSTTLGDLERMLIDETEGPRALPLTLLEDITDGFSENKEIGRGGFAVVYKGFLQTGTVAVKKLFNTYLHETEFQREVECLLNVKHRNIVRFLGYCADTQGSMQKLNKGFVMADVQQRVLCFEYVPNGSLLGYITDASGGLEWRERYRIIKGVCEGLNYLHKNRIFHLDLKPANILMDENMDPKIADFGLSRCFDEDQSLVMATKASGTLGYMPPEFNSRRLTRRYDIYSLGVIIIEILTGKKGYHATEDAVDSWRNRLGKSHEDVLLEQIRVCAEIGMQCIESNPENRPYSTQHIIDRLEQTECTYQSSFEQMSLSMPIERGSLHVHQCQLQFPLFDQDKFIFSPLHLTNNTNDKVSFRCLPKFPEGFVDGLSNLQGTIPPRSTATFLVWMEKALPQNTESFDLMLESCVLHESIENMEDNFSLKVRKQIGGKVHQVPLVALCNTHHREAIHPGNPFVPAKISSDTVGEMMTSEPIQPRIKVICRIEPDNYLVAMDVHPMKPWILAAHHNGNVSMWNYETQAKIAGTKIADIARSCVFIAREDLIVASDGRGRIHVRSCKTLELDEVKTIEAHQTWVVSFSVHPSLPLLLSGSTEEIKLWNWEKGWTCMRTFSGRDGHRGMIEGVMFNPHDDSPEDITFASVALDGTAKIWDIASPIPVFTLDCKRDQVLNVDYFPIGDDQRQYLITGSLTGNGRVFDLRTRRCIRVIQGLEGGPGCKVRVIDRLPDPPLLINILQGTGVGLCDTSTYRYKDTIFFGLRGVRNMLYVKRIRSAVIGFEGGLAILEID